MPTNILTSSETMVSVNDGAYGANKINYQLYINHLIGGEKNYSNGKLNDARHKTVTWDLLQKYPEDQISEILKASASEFPQVQAKSGDFYYNQAAEVVEFVVSNLQNMPKSNVQARIINNLLMKYDFLAYTGAYGNFGITGNPMLITEDSTVASDISAVLTAVSNGFADMKSGIGIRKTDYNQVAVGWTSGIDTLMSNVYTDTATNLDMFKKTYSTVVIDEVPEPLSQGAEYIELSYRPMVNFHHGSSPGIYNSEAGSHGLSTRDLFAFESTGVEIEEIGAIIRIPFTLPATP